MVRYTMHTALRICGNTSKHWKATISEDNVPVMGYMPWSALDLIALSTGKRRKSVMALFMWMWITKETEAMTASPKDSFAWYKKVIATNGKDMV